MKPVIIGTVILVIFILFIISKAKAIVPTPKSTNDSNNNNNSTNDSNNASMPNGNVDATIGPNTGDIVTTLFSNKRVLTASQISDYASAAGFESNDLQIAVAVALAESSGDTNAYNPETLANAQYGSYGLWQIFIDKHPEYASEDMFDPMNNANAAFAIYQAAGNSFIPWATFTNKSYQRYLNS